MFKFLLITAFIITPALSFAVGEELLWWVTNDSVSDVVPVYEGQSNPFPTYAVPIEVIKAKKRTNVDIEAAKNLAGATLLAKIRAYLQSGAFISPDIYTLKIKGYLEGVRGPEVLILDSWYGVGEAVIVPMQRLAWFNTMLDELSSIDEVLFDTVSDEIEDKLLEFNNFSLKISTINPNSVRLVDQNGEPYVISYISGGL